MRYALILTGLACVISNTALADNLGFEVGAYSWSQEYSGDVQTEGQTTIDVQDDLDFDDETGTVIYFALEHPIPLIPNLLVQHTDLEIEESTTLDRSITFDGTTYSLNEDIVSSSDLSHTDATLYYELLDNWAHLDFGLTIRQFDGGISISNSSSSAEEDIDEIIPLLYLAAKFELPLTGLYLGASVNGISVGDATLTDYQANLGYETEFGLGIEVGLRDFSLDYDDDGDKADIGIDGAYAGIFYHF